MAENYRKGQHLSLDGKAIRGAREAVKGRKRPPYTLNLIDVDTKTAMNLIGITYKQNEGWEMPELVEIIERNHPGILEGTTISTDAMGYSKNMIKACKDAGAYFFCPVKGNAPKLKAIIEEFIGFKGYCDPGSLLMAHSKNKGHSREEWRDAVCYKLGKDECIPGYEDIAQIGIITRYRKEKGKEPSLTQTVYVSTRRMTAEEFLYYSRSHWGCEVAHYILDGGQVYS